MKILIFKAPCPICKKVVFHAKEEGQAVQYFEVKEAKMMVIVATPEIDGKKRIALGPCQRKEPFHGENEEPVIYFAHPKHGCVPPPLPQSNSIDTSSSTMSNSGQVTQGVPLISPPTHAPIQVDPVKKT